jgi:rRNA small subunit pseudouridine methyltransferase Nep1
MFCILSNLQASLDIVLQNPVSDHLPVNTMKLSQSTHTSRRCPLTLHLALSGDAPTVRLSRFLPTLPETHSIAVFVGAMARGRDDFADHVVDQKISISDYPLSASVACGKVSACGNILNWNLIFGSYVVV